MKCKIILVFVVIMLMIITGVSNTLSIEMSFYNEENKNTCEPLSRTTDTFYSSTSDGMIGTWGSNYDDVRNADEGDVYSNWFCIRCGQVKSVYYQIDRAFLYFDTSSIPDNSPIISASLGIYGEIDYSETDFYIVVQNGQPTYPHDPMVSGDYDKDHYSGSGGTFHSSNFAENAYNTITLNSDGKSWINKQGDTKLCLRSKRDIDGNTPTELEFVSFSCSEDGSGYKPKLTVEYNSPPNKPSKPSGTTYGQANTEYTYTTSTTDPDGDDIKYWFDWDDGTNSGWIPEDWVASGTTIEATHKWECQGTYYVKAKAKDTYGAESEWSEKLKVTITNSPPYPPSTPSGPTSGYHGYEYCYSTSATDPENHDVYLWFDWGDGTHTGWKGPYTSGQSVQKCHTYNSPGTYYIKAKAKDQCEATSGWSGTLIVNMFNLPPNTPSNPDPEDGATWVETTTSLCWTGGDPNGDTVYYDVYLGDTYPPPLVTTVTTTCYDPDGELEQLTTYYWQIVAWDVHGGLTNGPIWSFTTREYHEPNLSKCEGWTQGHSQDEGCQKDEFVFCVHYYDEDQDLPVDSLLVIKNGPKFNMDPSGNPCDGEYYVEITGGNAGGGERLYYFYFNDGHDEVRFPPSGDEWKITVNYKPNKPTLEGPPSGVPGTEYTFSADTTDNDGDAIKYYFDWGDGTHTDWIGWESSGTTVFAKHTWNSSGTFTIKAKAKDRGCEDHSDWSDSINIIIPRNRALSNTLFLNFLEKILNKFPLLEKIIFQIFEKQGILLKNFRGI